MGLNIKRLYRVYDLFFARNLSSWCQGVISRRFFHSYHSHMCLARSYIHTPVEFGRAGRDGKPATATIIWHSRQKLKPCLRHFLKSENQCLRLIIARYFDPLCNPADIHHVLPGTTDAEKAHNCCIVCRERRTLNDPQPIKHVCECGVKRLTKFCHECGAKNPN